MFAVVSHAPVVLVHAVAFVALHCMHAPETHAGNAALGHGCVVEPWSPAQLMQLPPEQTGIPLGHVPPGHV